MDGALDQRRLRRLGLQRIRRRFERRLGLRGFGFQHEQVLVQVASIPGTTQRLPGRRQSVQRLTRTADARRHKNLHFILPQTFPAEPRDTVPRNRCHGIFHTTIMRRGNRSGLCAAKGTAASRTGRRPFRCVCELLVDGEAERRGDRMRQRSVIGIGSSDGHSVTTRRSTTGAATTTPAVVAAAARRQEEQRSHHQAKKQEAQQFLPPRVGGAETHAHQRQSKHRQPHRI